MVSDWRVFLKLCFQVFIVLSSADEAEPAVCTRMPGLEFGLRVIDG